MTVRAYLRPTGFVDSPFDLDGKVARLAGGLLWFAMVEIVVMDDLRRESIALVPIEGVETAMERLPDGARESARRAWEHITSARSPIRLGERVIRLDQPQIAGILNITPDSFSDGGRFGEDVMAAADAGFAMATAGAAIIDVGGESTRPGAKPVWEGDEVLRILPVVERLAGGGTALSVDTRKAAVMEAALAAAPVMINDVSALTFDPLAVDVIARSGCPIVLMHHQGPPETMQDSPRYDQPVHFEVYDWLEERIEAAIEAGIDRSNIIVDPGIGFGKNVQHNLKLMNGLAVLHGLGCPIMFGGSRKRFIGALSNEAPADQRLGGSIALAMKAAEQGAQILRVHDVPESVQALRVWRGLRDAALTP